MTILISCEMGGELVPPWLVRQPVSGERSVMEPAFVESAKIETRRSEFPAEVNLSGAIGDEVNRSEANRSEINRQDESFQSGGSDLLPGQFPEKLPGDAAARYVARRMASLLQSPLVENKYAADLIDVTRSSRHRSVMPPAVRKWPCEERDRLVQEVHAEYRNRIRNAVEQHSLRHGFTIHISIRSFALRSEGRLRRTDVGLLYDPSREDEMAFCLDWIDEMYDWAPMIRVRRNYPRRGTTESIVTAMRNHFTADRYIGVELLLNRAWAGRRVALRDQAIEGICRSLDEVLDFQSADAA
ncbi:N-formylglutamate amidohydrolase [Rhodopirellula maiorica SM1]|uniref:N-formylglutamate amidohydrolase n=1 Tax=Rhodopirellula maiorica SM1 TaxID=1265738 RepID=M5RR68_9BACT|nr:N-formylglutamate amidohydrolase [Rhodopirellula maiorica]EMI21716.1 N-formylglutamate amidohydrolase [Rhodopirellula maiorica SM1]